MNPALTVLHAHSGNLYGGVETALVTMAKYSAPLRHVFALSYEDRLAGYLRAAAADVEVLGPARISRPWTLRRARARLSRLTAARCPDVIVCHSPWALAAFGPVARSAGVPLVLWAHGAFTGRHWIEWLARLAATPDFAICSSEFTRGALTNLFHQVPSAVLYDPVAPPPVFDPHRRSPKREGHGAGPDTTVIALAARLEPWKGHVALLDALASLRDTPGWTAWIIGGAQRRSEDMYRSKLERLTNETRIADRVHFLGQRDDVASLLWASDIYCQPNTGPEGFGISFIEALYAGLPVVATDAGGPGEILTSACGILVPQGNPPALREALLRLIVDPALRSRLGAAGPARAASLCDPRLAAAKLAGVLAEVVGRRHMWQ